LSESELNSRHPCAGRAGVAWSIGLGLMAAWLAAGSLGILAASLQAALSWIALGAACLCARPRLRPAGWLGCSAIVLLLTLLPAVAPVRYGLTLTVAAVMGILAAGLAGSARRVMLAASLAALTFVLYRLAQQSVPAVWMLSDTLGGWLGQVAGIALGRPLMIGASFGGIDLLVVLGVFCAGWVMTLRGPRLAPAMFAVGAIVAVHFLYLATLAFTYEILRALPPVNPPGLGNPYVPPPFSWSVIARQMLPWNLPAVAALLYMALIIVLVRTGVYQLDGPSDETSRGLPAGRGRPMAAVVVLLGLAMSLPWLGMLRTAHSLDGKKIVANENGQLDWDVPQHDRYGRDAAGMYGMLPAFVASLGGELRISSELNQADLASADALLLLHPDTSLSWEQQDRVWQYVRAGGSLVVVTEGFLPENGLERRVNELLQPTAMSVNRDAAVSETGDWWGSLRALEHPATTAVYPGRERFFSDGGASIETSWPARPLAVGIWGWSAPEQGATWADNQNLPPGAKLGDLVLAAEQRVGAGRVIVIGDHSSLTNEGLVNGHALVGDLLSYLAAPVSGPQVLWRQIVFMLCLAGLLTLLAWHIRATTLVASCVLLASSLAVGQLINTSHLPLVPDGAKVAPRGPAGPQNRIAYIDATHLEPYSVQAWAFDALNGLALNLARNGYLPLTLNDFTAARLEHAALLVSIGPSRRFSAAERAHVRQFVERGGILISMVGAEEADASAALLEDFGLRVPPSPVPTTGSQYEPEPFGRTRASYLEVEEDENARYQAAVRLYAAWPIEAQADGAVVLAYGRNQLPVVQSNAELPVILTCQCGQGHVVLIGDTCFAMNKNLEYIGGDPFHGAHENAHFWRWLLTRLQGLPEWVPPRPPASVQKSDEEAADESPEEES
jgi:hypothetical protein